MFLYPDDACHTGNRKEAPYAVAGKRLDPSVLNLDRKLPL